MSPVDFKKWPCHPVKFKGQGPHSGHRSKTSDTKAESRLLKHRTSKRKQIIYSGCKVQTNSVLLELDFANGAPGNLIIYDSMSMPPLLI